jgi:hypothetical protein
VCQFNTDGTIVSPNAPRPTQAASGFACYGAAALLQINSTCGALRDRNRRYYNIGQPTGAAAGVQVPLACHHVIGWDVIWGFWNALITQRDFKIARSYLAVCGVAQPDTAKLEKQVGNNTFVAGANWDAKLCWNPINLVRGPEDRTDDPNGLPTPREKIDFRLAPADSYDGRVAKLVETGNAMCDYMDAPTKTAKATKAIQYLTSIRSKPIMEWDESIWVVDKTRPGYSSTPALAGGFLVVRPSWKIINS